MRCRRSGSACCVCRSVSRRSLTTASVAVRTACNQLFNRITVLSVAVATEAALLTSTTNARPSYVTLRDVAVSLAVQLQLLAQVLRSPRERCCKEPPVHMAANGMQRSSKSRKISTAGKLTKQSKACHQHEGNQRAHRSGPLQPHKVHALGEGKHSPAKMKDNK